MKIAIFGNKTTTEALVEHLIENKVSIFALVIFRVSTSGSKSIAGYSAGLKDLARLNRIQLIEVDDYALKSLSDQEKIISQRFDLGIVTGWQRLIPVTVLKTFSIGVFGWHGSFLKFPNGRGRSPYNWSIRLGAERIFHNLFMYASAADAGEVFETVEFSIAPDDYISDVQAKALSHMKSSSLRLVEACLSDSPIKLLAQPEEVSVHFPKISPKDGKLQPNRHTAEHAINIIRSASHPFSGAYFEGTVRKITVWRASLIDDANSKTIRVDFIDRPVFFIDYHIDEIIADQEI
jgi:methionyl-tRNA formyltransferase